MALTRVSRLKFGSFTARIFILSVLISVVPLLVMGLIYDNYTQQMLARINEERISQRLEIVSERISAFMADRFGELEMLSDYPPLKSRLSSDLILPEPDVVHALIEYQADQSHLYGILLLTNDGDMVASFAPTLSKRVIDWKGQQDQLPFRRLHRYRAHGLLGPTAVEGVDGPILFLYQRVYRDWERRRPIGLVALHLEVDALVSLIAGFDDGALVPLLRSPDGQYFNTGVKAPAPTAEVRASKGLADGWELVITADESVLMAPLIQLRKTLLMMLTGALVAILVVIGLFYRHSAGRIRKLTEGAEAIAQGDLDWRLEDHGNDELSRLSGTFNRMAEQLQGLIDSAVQTEKMASLGKLATTIAHEVRNPLASIKTGVQVVLENMKDRDQEQILGNVVAEIDRLNRVASELLDYARPVPTRSEKASVEYLVDRVRSLIERQAHKMNVQVDVSVDTELSIWVDPNQIQQVLMNLVLNSLNAMPEGGALALKARLVEHRVVIAVEDNGHGIPADKLERLIVPFPSARPDGTGIGLSVSNQLVERNQGRMEIHSVPEQGTTVSLSFPPI